MIYEQTEEIIYVLIILSIMFIRRQNQCFHQTQKMQQFVVMILELYFFRGTFVKMFVYGCQLLAWAQSGYVVVVVESGQWGIDYCIVVKISGAVNIINKYYNAEIQYSSQSFTTQNLARLFFVNKGLRFQNKQPEINLQSEKSIQLEFVQNLPFQRWIICIFTCHICRFLKRFVIRLVGTFSKCKIFT
eukprot:TRINITY_DN5565_c0_g1_i9.p3 TRINITY_DN5565_c0_g1~~TRINITY_DN5565_c0_g1_i9.p3  ORF type:complete len:188 (-),score=-5.36 TRINITY_DN5565_c0_g1_i9:111-674(-)